MTRGPERMAKVAGDSGSPVCRDAAPPLRLLIVCPAPRPFRVERRRPRPSVRMRVFRCSQLSALSVAAAAPPGVECRIVDENVEALDFDTPTDLVGISFMTFNAPRAYEIAREFKARGRTVLFGGYHPTLQPAEAKRHADAVCVGAAEPNLPVMISDFRAGQLRPCYARTGPFAPTRRPDYTLLRARRYLTPAVIQATRGCPHACEFCSVSVFSRRRFQMRAVSEVIEEIRRSPGRSFLFMDDNLVGDMTYARELFQALVPLRRRWFGQVGVNCTHDPRFVDLMRESGCRGVFMGFESLQEASLAEAGKRFNRAATYREAVARLHERGIAVMGALVLGFDHDTPACFEATRRFLDEAGLDALQLTILTPLPGTPLFARLERQHRILDWNWEHYDLGHVVYAPRQLTPERLAMGHAGLLAAFYSWPAIARRFLRQWRYLSWQGTLLSLLVGVGYRFKLRQTGVLTQARLGTSDAHNRRGWWSGLWAAPPSPEAPPLPGRAMVARTGGDIAREGVLLRNGLADQEHEG